MFFQKYKLIKEGERLTPEGSHSFFDSLPVQVKTYRIKALRDIPQWQVKKGDLGGLVTGKKNLSHEGNSWIEFNAQVYGNVVVQDNALISGKAVLSGYAMAPYGHGGSITVKDNAVIKDSALVINQPSLDPDYFRGDTVISGDAVISGKAKVYNVGTVSKYAKIEDEAVLLGAWSVEGHSRISGRAKLRYNVHVSGFSEISDDAVVDINCRIYDSVLAGKEYINPELVITNHHLSKSTFHNRLEAAKKPSQPAQSKKTNPSNITPKGKVNLTQESSVKPVKMEASLESKHAVKLFAEVLADIAEYETDIVKIIKYPSMTDRSVAETREMTIALKRAKRFADTPESNEFIEAVNELEAKFLTAESVALKLTSTNLTLEEKKKTQKASDLLALASNEAASDNERAQAFKQAFKQLEGVIAVPEIAVETFKIKIGLKELES